MSEFFVRDLLCLVCVCKPNTRLSLQQIIYHRWDTLKFIYLLLQIPHVRITKTPLSTKFNSIQFNSSYYALFTYYAI